MLKFGYISELDVPNGMARVYFTDDEVTSNWLPMSVPKSLKDKFMIPFDINEQVWCMMDEHAEFGVIGGAIYSSADTPDSNAGEGKITIKLVANSYISYDRNEQTLEFNIAGDITIKSNGNVKIEAAKDVDIKAINATVEATGNATVKGAAVKIDAPATTVTGTLDVAGALTAASFAGVSGAALSAPNGMSANGDVNATGDVKAGAISLKLHKHTGSGAGNLTSPPV